MLFFFSSFVAFSVINNMFHIINIIKIQNDEFKFDKLVKYYRVNYYLDPWFSERISARLEYATRSSTRRKITTRFTRWHISPRRAKANRSSSLPRKFHFQICNRVSSSLRHPSYLLQFHSTVLKPTTKRYKKLQVESRQNSRRPKILPSKISLLQDTYIYIYIRTPLLARIGAPRLVQHRSISSLGWWRDATPWWVQEENGACPDIVARILSRGRGAILLEIAPPRNETTSRGYKSPSVSGRLIGRANPPEIVDERKNNSASIRFAGGSRRIWNLRFLGYNEYSASGTRVESYWILIAKHHRRNSHQHWKIKIYRIFLKYVILLVMYSRLREKIRLISTIRNRDPTN